MVKERKKPLHIDDFYNELIFARSKSPWMVLGKRSTASSYLHVVIVAFYYFFYLFTNHSFLYCICFGYLREIIIIKKKLCKHQCNYVFLSEYSYTCNYHHLR